MSHVSARSLKAPWWQHASSSDSRGSSCAVRLRYDDNKPAIKLNWNSPRSWKSGSAFTACKSEELPERPAATMKSQRRPHGSHVLRLSWRSLVQSAASHHDIGPIGTSEYLLGTTCEAAEGTCGKLNFWLYGFRKAAAAWEAHYSEKLEKEGFERGWSCGVVFYHKRGVFH